MRQPRIGVVWPLVILMGLAACETRDDVSLDPERTTVGDDLQTGTQDQASFVQDMNRNLDQLDANLNDHREAMERDGQVQPGAEENIQQLENEVQQLRQRLANMSQRAPEAGQADAWQQEAREIERQYQQLEQRVERLGQRQDTTSLQR